MSLVLSEMWNKGYIGNGQIVMDESLTVLIKVEENSQLKNSQSPELPKHTSCNFKN